MNDRWVFAEIASRSHWPCTLNELGRASSILTTFFDGAGEDAQKAGYQAQYAPAVMHPRVDLPVIGHSLSSAYDDGKIFMRRLHRRNVSADGRRLANIRCVGHSTRARKTFVRSLKSSQCFIQASSGKRHNNEIVDK